MIEIIKKTTDYVIIYKPQGVPSQSDPTGDKDAMTECSEILRSLGEKDSLYLIHRLDRVVGGLIVFARNKQTAAVLSSLVAERLLEKEYYAVVEGTPEGGILKDYIYKDSTSGKAFVTDRKRVGVKEAELEYKTLSTADFDNRKLSLVKIRLKTGRFHQIRVQFASRKMPLIGDKKYGSKDFKAKMPSLFAAALAFDFKGKRVLANTLPRIDEYPWSLFDKEKYQ